MNTAEQNIVLQTHRISKRYQTKYAVNEVDLELRAGEIMGLVGRNGAGKTTLMKMITGLCRPTAGSVTLFGSAEDLERKRHRIGTIVETPNFFPYFNALQNLEYFRLQRGVGSKAEIESVLRQVELWDERTKKFKAYSLGMKQRLGIALALLGKPEILILDEPTNGIDPEGIVELRLQLIRLAQERNVAILISSHILGELQNMASSYSIIDEGRIVARATAKELAKFTADHLVVQVENAPKALALLEKDFGLQNCHVNQNAQLILPSTFTMIPEMIEFLVHNGIRIHAVERHGMSLEEYFLHAIHKQEVTHV